MYTLYRIKFWTLHGYTTSITEIVICKYIVPTRN